MTTTEARSVLSGLDVLFTGGGRRLAGRRIAVITNQTGVDRHFQSVIDLCQGSELMELVALFGPEHGVRGEAQAGVKVAAAVDPRTGLPVYSLYGETDRPTPDMLKGLDALVFDIQDVGVRYATYVATMAHAQEAAADAGVAFVVLDRPNPLSGACEGNVLGPAFESFVGVHPIPIRHGMTVGELARLFATDHGWPEPEVVLMRNWQRPRWFDETGLPWVQPSPNLPTLDSVTLYPGTCLMEGTNVSEGRGTTKPFELIGAPWLDPFALSVELERRRLPGVAFRPTYFTPMFSKHAQQLCGGIQVHIVDRVALRPVEVGLHVLHAVRLLSDDMFAWRAQPEGGYFIDLLLGTERAGQALDTGAEVSDVTTGWRQQAEAFTERRRPALLYP